MRPYVPAGCTAVPVPARGLLDACLRLVRARRTQLPDYVEPVRSMLPKTPHRLGRSDRSPSVRPEVRGPVVFTSPPARCGHASTCLRFPAVASVAASSWVRAGLMSRGSRGVLPQACAAASGIAWLFGKPVRNAGGPRAPTRTQRRTLYVLVIVARVGCRAGGKQRACWNTDGPAGTTGPFLACGRGERHVILFGTGAVGSVNCPASSRFCGQ